MYREITHLFSPELQSKTSVQVEEKFFKGKRNEMIFKEVVIAKIIEREEKKK